MKIMNPINAWDDSGDGQFGDYVELAMWENDRPHKLRNFIFNEAGKAKFFRDQAETGLGNPRIWVCRNMQDAIAIMQAMTIANCEGQVELNPMQNGREIVGEAGNFGFVATEKKFVTFTAR